MDDYSDDKHALVAGPVLGYNFRVNIKISFGVCNKLFLTLGTAGSELESYNTIGAYIFVCQCMYIFKLMHICNWRMPEGYPNVCSQLKSQLSVLYYVVFINTCMNNFMNNITGGSGFSILPVAEFKVLI